MNNLLPALRRRSAVCFLQIFFSCFFLAPLHGQTPDPDCSLIRVTQSSGQVGDTVWLEVRGNIPNDLFSAQFVLSWNTDQLAFAQLGLSGSALNVGISDFNPTQPGRIRFSWFDFGGSGIPVPNDALFFKVGFTLEAGAGAFNQVKIGSTPSFQYEISVLPFVFLPENCIHGGIYNNPAPVDGPFISEICIENAGCNPNFAFGNADISVAGGIPPYQFIWFSEQGQPLVDTEDLTKIAPGMYTVVVTDQNGLSTVANTEIGTTKSEIMVQAIVKDDPCRQYEGSIDLTVSGGHPPYFYQWSVGSANSTSVSGLLAGVYTVTVTDAGGCSMIRGYSVSGLLPMFVDDFVNRPSCGSPSASGSIALSLWGGSPPYNYTWNVPGANGAVLTNISSGVYSVTISDANGCSVAKSYALSDLETDSWTVFQNTFCDPVAGPGQILLFINGGDDLSWPLNTFWSTGATHILNGSPNFSVLDSLHSLPDGAYSVMLQDAAGCRKSIGEIKTDCETQLAYDGKTCFQLRIGSAAAQPGEIVCIPITAENFTGIWRIESTIRWDTSVLLYQGVYSTALPPALSVQTYAGGYARIRWQLPNDFPDDGISLPDGSTLYALCFQVKNTAATGAAAIRFGPDYYGAGTFQIKTLDPYILGILGFEGEIQVGGPLPDRLNLSACATLPTCATDMHTDYTLDIANGTPPYTVQWDTGNGIQTGTLDDLKYRNAGKNYVTITDQNGKTAAAALTQFAGSGAHTCVWPGDADNNNAVNQYDLLYLAYALGGSGIPRLEQGAGWQGYWQGVFPGFDWGMTTPLRHIDFSNMDCDGNGKVDEQDVDILLQHWGQVVRPGIDDPNLAPPLPNDVNSAIFDVFVQPDTVHTDSLNLLLQVGDFNAPATNINGLAFSIFYDTAAIEANTLQFIPTASWLGDPDSTLLWVQKNFPDQGRLDLAISRKGIHPQSGFGPVGLLQGLLNDDMFRPKQHDLPETLLSGDTMLTTMFRIGNLVAMSDQEKSLAAAGLETPVTFVQEILTNTKQPATENIRAYLHPNPARDYTTVFCPAAQMERVEIVNMHGTVLHTQTSAGSTIRLETGQLPGGFYWVRVHTAAGSTWIKLSVQH